MIRLETRIERWQLIEPFATARDSIDFIPVLVATLTGRAGHRGWAEAAGVDYDGETPSRWPHSSRAFATRCTTA